ncbi:MAG: DsbA family protein [Thermoanaerobaculaceae bacterium]|jgi:protein-disulfide isomerase|nr:DsbA family protein [Thermoanaerobaculaceae bacterium]
MKQAVPVSILIGLVASAALAQSQKPAPPPTAAAVQEPAVATFAGQAITALQLEAVAGPRLLRARNEEYKIKAELAQELASDRLKSDAASKLGVTLPELYRLNVTEKAGEPAKEEVDELLKRYRSQLPPDDAQAREEVVRYLKAQRTRELEQAWQRDLLAGAGFRLLIDPPRASVPVSDTDPSRGPAGAPITVIEFSDFQCPYCGRVQPTMQRLRLNYGERLRVVFKQLPLAMHQHARAAAEASLCAGQQGKFWEMHDWMFANQTRIAPDAFKAAATELKIDSEAFAKCVDSKAMAGKVDEDMKAAEGLGITGTPAFLVNGRLIEGAQPFEAFQDVIDDELARQPAVAGTR